MVAALCDAVGEGERAPGGVGEGLIGDDDGAVGEKGRQGFGEPGGEGEARLAIARADVGVGKDGGWPEALRGTGQRVAKLAGKHVVIVGDAVGMGGDLPVEAVDVALAQTTAQMVEGAAVAKPDFKNVTGPVPDKAGGFVEAQTLGLKAANGAVEPAHPFRTPPWRHAAGWSSFPRGGQVHA